MAPSVVELERLGLRVLAGNFLLQDHVVRHDTARLARAILRHFAVPVAEAEEAPIRTKRINESTSGTPDCGPVSVMRGTAVAGGK